jgi:hypothetical protein
MESAKPVPKIIARLPGAKATVLGGRSMAGKAAFVTLAMDGADDCPKAVATRAEVNKMYRSMGNLFIIT